MAEQDRSDRETAKPPPGERPAPMDPAEAARAALAAAKAAAAAAKARPSEPEASKGPAPAPSSKLPRMRPGGPLKEEGAKGDSRGGDARPKGGAPGRPTNHDRPPGPRPGGAAGPGKGPPPTAPAPSGVLRRQVPGSAPGSAPGPAPSAPGSGPLARQASGALPRQEPAKRPGSGPLARQASGALPRQEAAQGKPPARPAGEGGKPGPGKPAPNKPAAKKPAGPGPEGRPARGRPGAPGRPAAKAGKTRPGAKEPGRKEPGRRGPPRTGPARKGPAPARRPGGAGATPAALGALAGLPRGKKGKHLASFAELGWACTPREDEPRAGTDVLAIDLGSEGTCATFFDEDLRRARDQAHPTMVLVRDPHAFRTLEPFSLKVGLPALERWPNDRVMRGTTGAILLPSQIGLVEFPAAHVLSGLVGRLRHDLEREPRQLALTLPTFMASDLGQEIRDVAAPYRKGAFRGVPSAIAAAWFYLAPALAEQAGAGVPGELLEWSKRALAAGHLLVLDWGASGLNYGLVTVRQAEDKTELRLALAGVWPSLSGHRLTLAIVRTLHRELTDRILAAGPSDDLIQRPLFDPRSGQVPRPVGYELAFTRLALIGTPMNPTEEAEVAALRNLLLPTRWRFGPGEEPAGYSPFRKLAIEHFRKLWLAAERIKRLIFSDPARYRQRGSVPWSADALDSPFVSDIESRALEVPVAGVLDPVEAGLRECLAHIVRRVQLNLREGAALPVALTGMQAASPLLREAAGRAAASVEVSPTSSDPLELKSVVNRGAALLFRDKKGLDFGPIPEVLPFSVQIADCLGNVTIFAPGPLDELSVFQRRIRVEEGFPQFEFFLYESEDATLRGPWGCIDFHRPFEFTEEDQTISVDPRYGFNQGVPTLRELRGDDPGAERELRRCFDRGDPKDGRRGLLSFRAYAPRTERARQLLHFLENGLKGSFHRKVYLLEREFPKPPARFDYIYQRYYLSRSQELLVVREWWAPVEDGKLLRQKSLHTCQGSTEANALLGLEWGTY
ncbi:MAG: hypothetical protein AB7T09_37725 [Planctomycetota bacterium]